MLVFLFDDTMKTRGATLYSGTESRSIRVLRAALQYSFFTKEVTQVSRNVAVEVPDDLFEYLTEQANAAGTTPGEWISKNLSQIVRKPDERLRRHFGSVDLGRPIGISNEQIDADLAREYGKTHEPGAG